MRVLNYLFTLCILCSCEPQVSEEASSVTLGENDVVVKLNIENADSSLRAVIFRTDVQNEVIVIHLDSVRNSYLKFGYQVGGESAYFIDAVFQNDTISDGGYAEKGYRPELSLTEREFEIEKFH